MRTIYFAGDIITLKNKEYADALILDGEKVEDVGILEDLSGRCSFGKPINLDNKALIPAPKNIELNKELKNKNLLSVMTEDNTKSIKNIYKFLKDNTNSPIEKDKKANFIILSKNPLTCDKEELKNIKIINIIKNGELI